MAVEEVFALCGVVLLFATLITAATTDILHRKIYNWLTYPAIAFGLALGYGAGGLGDAWGDGLLSHLAGLGLAFGLFFVVWWSRAVQGGEVKLAAAIGAIGGFPFVVPALFWSSLVGAVLAIWILLFRGELGRGLARAVRYGLSFKSEVPGGDDPAAARVPYALALACGTMLAWFLTELPAA